MNEQESPETPTNKQVAWALLKSWAMLTALVAALIALHFFGTDVTYAKRVIVTLSISTFGFIVMTAGIYIGVRLCQPRKP